MIGLDTNVIIRYVTQDDAQQSSAATALIESLDEQQPGFVSIVAVAETGWVLTRSYGVDGSTLADVFDRLLDAREIVVQHSDTVRLAVDGLRRGAEFADAVIAGLGRAAGCDQTMTFDRGAAQRAGMTLLGPGFS